MAKYGDWEMEAMARYEHSMADNAAISALVNSIAMGPSKPTPSLASTKQSLRPEKRMRVGHYYFCDGCSQPIYRPDDGFVIHGNIYVADPGCRGGLIGNNFPDVKPGDKIEVTDVKETVLCRDCFQKALGTVPTSVGTGRYDDEVPF